MMKFLATLWLLIAVVAKPSSTTFSQNHEPCRPAVCPKIRKLDGVCDQEGKDYGNDCFFKVAACEAKKNGKILILTPCPHVKNQEPCRQLCPLLQYLDGVCDQEGKDYGNNCYFEVAACKAKRNGKILIRTPCPPVKDEFRCTRICPLLYSPVCDSNGQSYPNECSFEIERCIAEEKGENLILAVCPEKINEQFPLEQDPCRRPCILVYSPVCDSEGKIHDNECWFETAKCIAEKKGENLIEADCPEGINEQFPSKKGRKLRSLKDEVRCVRACHRLYDPVCDSAGKSYANKCIFEIAQCRAENKGEKLILADCPEGIDEQFPSEGGIKMRSK